MSRSCQGHLKVKQAKILSENLFLQFFVAKECSTRLQLTLFWLRSLPTRILGGTVNIMWLGGVIPTTTLKSMQKMVNWSPVEHGIEVTIKHLRHPHLSTKGDMGWSCPLLGFYCRVRSRSYQGHFKVKTAIILNKNMFLQFPYVFCCN